MVYSTTVKKSKQTRSTNSDIIQPAVKELKQKMYVQNRNAKCLKRREAVIQKQVCLIET